MRIASTIGRDLSAGKHELSNRVHVNTVKQVEGSSNHFNFTQVVCYIVSYCTSMLTAAY